MSGIFIPLIIGNILLTLGEAIVSNVYSSFLYLEGSDNSTSSEAAAIVYDSRVYKPKKLRIGVVCSPNCSGTMNIDKVSIKSRV